MEKKELLEKLGAKEIIKSCRHLTKTYTMFLTPEENIKLKRKLTIRKGMSIDDLKKAKRKLEYNGSLYKALIILTGTMTVGGIATLNPLLIIVGGIFTYTLSSGFVVSEYNRVRVMDTLRKHQNYQECRVREVRASARIIVNQLSRVKEVKDSKGNIVFKPQKRFAAVKDLNSDILEYIDEADLKKLRRLQKKLSDMKASEYIEEYNQAKNKVKMK